MKLGNIIGKVVLSKSIPQLTGARYLLVSPFTQEQFQDFPSDKISRQPSLVVYDDIGGGSGDKIGYIEGREAASPFDPPIPIDAINGAIVDEIFYTPVSK
jgi:microcompartment protein CcmK/EutM